MKIGIYSFHPYPDPKCGQTTRMASILAHVSRSSEVVVYCPNPKPERQGREFTTCATGGRSVLVRTFHFRLGYRAAYNDIRVCGFLRREYQNGAFDVLQVENSEGAFVLLSRVDFPIVGVFHGRLLKENSYSARLSLSKGELMRSADLTLLNVYTYFCERKLARVPNLLIATSNLVKDYAVELGAEPEKVQVLKNGVNVREYEEYASRVSKLELRRALNIPEESFVFVFHGSMLWDQNVEAVRRIIEIRNWFEENDVRGNYFFLVVGGPIEKIGDLHAPAENMLFTGYVEDVKPYLYSADCGLAPFPEDAEAGGPRLKMIEFLAAGLPVITSKTGVTGFEEIVSNSPIYILGRDNNELRSILRSLDLESRDTRVEEFDWSAIAAQNEEILAKVLETA